MGGSTRRVEDSSDATLNEGQNSSMVSYNKGSSWKTTSLSRNVSRNAEYDEEENAEFHRGNAFDENNVHGIIMSEKTLVGEVHKVGIPEYKSSVHQFNAKVKETFFPDDPFRQFKGQPWGRKLWLGFQYFFSILEWAPRYSIGLFKSDVVSGITIASLAIPQGISYARLASLPPILGLYSSFVPPLIYSVLGSSRDLAVGPVSIASLLLGAILREEVSPTDNPVLYLQLGLTATFFAGVFQASLGVLRMGFVIDFLSRATLVGFMAGAAVIVSLQQFKSLLGIKDFTSKMDMVSVMDSVFKHPHEWTWQTAVMGVFFLLFLLMARYISRKKTKFFWISAAAPLTSVILATVFSFISRSENHGISIIGHLQKGLNPISTNMLFFHGPYLALALKAGLVSGLIALTEGIAVGRTFASIKDYQVDGNKEMMAIGLMNMTGSCTSCYVTTGSFSRSAVNFNAGCKSAVSNIVMAITVMVTLLFLTPLFYHTPVVVLSSIIIAAVVGLIDFPAAYFIWKVDKVDFLACMGAFMGVIFISVQTGLLIAVGISVLKILLHVTRPHTILLGNIPGTSLYRNMEQYKEALRVSGFLILGIESPIYFANSSYLRERILRWVQDEEERTKKEKENTLQYVILDITAVTTIDTTGINGLLEVKKTLVKRDLKVALVNPGSGVMDKLQRANMIESFGQDSFYLTVGEAVSSLSSVFKQEA
ncbi:hypothetical protein SUGI_0691840 [Cryptomeria japonica]|uniref:probable sulfate transporter 3.3 n=1 Tax=Cryptomeria japonica TaxID=3369 RepID=UPI0024147F92|nr:probable sulfate transporter 3.3 [Cryptomeria japonica]GLJ34407.1 hypothetical protein SUGI_0691840 [Cryptomeria japonica]